jgi:hypothetical protein
MTFALPGGPTYRRAERADVSSCREISVLLGGASVRDILSQGGDREPSPWPRRLAAIAVVVTALALVVVYFPRHRHSPAPSPRAATTEGAAPSVPGAGPPASGGPREPDGIIGQTLPMDAALRLPVTGEQPAWFWPATGRMEPIGGLPPARSGYLFSRVGGGWAVRPDPAAQPGCGSCAGQPLPVYFLADRARSVTRVGAADEVAPATTAGALWLTSYPPGADMSTAAGTAREVSAAGATLRPQLRLPAGYVIEQATSRGMLLAQVIRQPAMATYKLWDPADPQASRTFDGVIAASASAIAWAPRCAPRCRVHVLDLATGRETVIRLPAGSSAAAGAFSPDGGFLAVQVSLSPGGDSGELPTQLEVAPVASGHLTVVPGSQISSDALNGFGWPGGGDSLVAELSFTTKVQVASWRPGAARPAIAVIRPAHTSASLVVG